ncbi:hypothetical protein N181_06030 [Sinorhizobium fredii USDA 205]|uniref:Uncharacterized protein n=2 Tax=Rhizobium fredii TaxID=380 RepID=A0A2A6LXR9_RHIFR|nr:hypothetical protein [Sinorhizobium fredii]ASY68041.1 putative transmembrane protein [Sinorhizobium fredii CCBAU 83666]AWM23970.1 putative transmembrane protein [Sinorhizobium fredii CCBAU 25509]KSV81623.1 hypothetical protein N181_06030 [Sinorhizobium fredii USDA 205]MQW99586.1 hypothetical protein [Sinorhizobium fredii]MQX12965.1 hypothetical protein [Sinorhizobium fredii]
MNFRMMTAAGLVLVLAGCTTTTGVARNAVEKRWLGQPAGTFFAQFGPPLSDVETGGDTVYSWKGGYKTRRIPAEYEKTADGKRGKRISAARTEYLSCAVQLTVSSDYVIRSIRIAGDRKRPTGPSWCEEFLGGAKAE